MNHYVIFAIGCFVGTFLGVFLLGLCTMGADERPSKEEKLLHATYKNAREGRKVKCNRCGNDTRGVIICGSGESRLAGIEPVCNNCFIEDMKKRLDKSWRIDLVFHVEGEKQRLVMISDKKAEARDGLG